jgi:DNA recombination protein RmuC
MDIFIPTIIFFVGLLAGAGTVWTILKKQLYNEKRTCTQIKIELSAIDSSLKSKTEALSKLEEQFAQLQNKNHDLRSNNQELEKKLVETKVRREEETKALKEKIEALDRAEQKLSNAFKSLSSDALKSNNKTFLELAKSTFQNFHDGAKGDLEKRQQAVQYFIKPLEQSLKKVSDKMQEIEKGRIESSSSLNQQIKSLSETQIGLQQETGNLVSALRKPGIRGSWGELQLRRAVEFSGMVEYCDFTQQESTTSENGRYRPDMIVNLPNGRRIIVDAKTPMHSYLKAIESKEKSKQNTLLKSHARDLRERIKELSLKKYWEQFDQTPELVILFLPNEMLFRVALEQDASLIEFGTKSKVILSSPTTFIAILRAVAYGWQQDKITMHAKQIKELGQDLYDRIGVLAEHWATLGKHLDKTIDSYNKAIRSVETRILVTARKFKDLGSATDKEISELEPVEKVATLPIK